MFKTDLDKWYDNLPPHTKAFAFGAFVGLLIGLIL